MSISEHDRFKLKHLMHELDKCKGRHTELVTVYVPAGYEISKITNQLLQEQGTASNIKSASTRNNVITALERMVQHLRQYPRTPPNGLAAFSGNVSEREGGMDFRVWSIEPPVPLNIKIYRCDKNFVLEPLMDMCEIKEVYGLVVLDKREANVAFLKGKTIIPLAKATSGVPGKHKTGGQSAQRMERLRDEAAKEFYKRVADIMKDQFFGNSNLKGIIIGGPGTSKNEFIEQGQITAELKQKIIGTKDLSYTDEYGLQELLERSEDILSREGVMEEKKLMRKFFETLATNSRMVTYGYSFVKAAIERGAVDTVLCSESIEDEKVDEIEELAKSFGTKVEYISVETREGIQLRDMGKIAALLRYSIEE